VTQAGCPVELTVTEFSLLEALLGRHGERVCSRTELLREVWRMPQAEIAAGPGTNIVEVYINYLRKKLGTKPAGSVIRTVRGEGYRLEAPAIGLEAAETRAEGAAERWCAHV